MSKKKSRTIKVEDYSSVGYYLYTKFMEPRELNIPQFANLLGIKPLTLLNILTGKYLISEKLDERACQILNLKAGTLRDYKEKVKRVVPQIKEDDEMVEWDIVESGNCEEYLSWVEQIDLKEYPSSKRKKVYLTADEIRKILADD